MGVFIHLKLGDSPGKDSKHASGLAHPTRAAVETAILRLQPRKYVIEDWAGPYPHGDRIIEYLGNKSCFRDPFSARVMNWYYSIQACHGLLENEENNAGIT